MCGRGWVCGGTNVIVCLCVCVYVCVRLCAEKGEGGEIYFGKAQQLCMSPSMFGLLFCIFGEG